MVDKFDYVDAQKWSNELIEEFGFSDTEATHTQATGVKVHYYDPEIGSIVQNVTVVILPLNNGEKQTMIANGDTNIESYYKIIVSGADIANGMKIGSTFTADSESYKVLSYTKVKPYKTALIYKCMVEIK